MTLCEFISSELINNLRFIQVSDPFDIVPKVFRSLHQRIFGLLENKLSLKQQCLLPVRKYLLFQLLHLVVVEQPTSITMGKKHPRLAF